MSELGGRELNDNPVGDVVINSANGNQKVEVGHTFRNIPPMDEMPEDVKANLRNYLAWAYAEADVKVIETETPVSIDDVDAKFDAIAAKKIAAKEIDKLKP